ncbi:putative 5-formyltetrahydrofolate cyclo-ligase [Nitrososphaera viennensis EN76]|uniref:Putative 5-formyltetrahydrofolate cyclo-ligase n=1 Tax=Nitrososphaera viennensis EN76 TaxID=926571 RepID=A0A060HEJ4_9ARCH|nr:putative 5-formyltetrahydrofolate cyclo-ligase [Nitrososphaera viennensis EN76]
MLVQESAVQSKEFEKAQVVGAYYPKGSEVRTALLIGIAKEQGKKVALPRTEGNDMRLYEYEPADKLVPGKFGIMEPAPKKRLVERVDLLLVPGVAFDRKGCRIGYGKGYYDRFISEGGASFSMGLAYSIQIVDELPRGRFDRKLGALATENGLLYF